MAEFTHSTRLNIYDFQHPSHAVRLYNSNAALFPTNSSPSLYNGLQRRPRTSVDRARLSLPSLLAFATQRVEIVPEWQSRLLHASTSLSTLFITIASFFTSLDRSLSPSPCPIEQYTTPQTRPALDSAPPRRAGATTDMGIPVVLAIFVGLACSFIQSLGLTIQRKSHVQDEAKPLSERQRAVTRPLWIIGFAIYISSNVFGSVFQIGALPIVVLAPLGGVSLLWNSVLAHVLLGEGFTSAMMLGTVLIATGAALIAIFGVVPDGNHSLDELLALWARPPFVAFFVIVCLAVAGVLAIAHITTWRIQRIALPLRDGSPSNYASPREEAAIPFLRTHETPTRASTSPGRELAGFDAKVRFAEPEETNKTLTYCGLAFAAASGTLSGLCLVLAKASVELVITTIDHWRTGKGQNEFARVQTWFLVAGLAVAAVLQLVYLNYSLAFASPALICPLAFCFYNLASIFDGLVFYDQFGRLKPHQLVLVSVGTAILLVGVWTVSAVQPTGDGGVEVGTWVEEEWTPWLDEEAVVDEPIDETFDELEAAEDATILETEEPADSDHDHPVRAVPPTSVTVPPRSASVPSSPQSPVSPTQPRRKRLRFGTLIPELAPAGAPTGFAFGIGAASPGFALRSNSVSLSHGPARQYSTPPQRRTRSRSEVSGHAPASRVRPLSMPIAPIPGPSSAPGAPETVEADLSAWDTPRRERWRLRFPSFFGGRGNVKLP